ncbi:hypothetical protein [Nonomuraea dietziae]|uniref:hypothetical protein n=1 Tax=Nonomuraea dietziae TaxID=65515 RepID=UPI003409548F
MTAKTFIMRILMMLTALTATAALTSSPSSASVLMAPAQASSPTNARAEYEIRTAYYHALDRRAAQSVVRNYMGLTNRHCTWGLSDAAFRLTTSSEARQRWGDAQSLAGMLYAALLRREPDDQGLRTYASAISTYGLTWSARQMMGSAEYRHRLAGICGTKNGLSGAMFDWETSMDFAVHLTDRARNLAAGCAAIKGVQKLTRFKDNARNARAFIGITGEITKKLHGKLDGTCAAVLTYIQAALKIAMVVKDGGDGQNPVFIQSQTHKSWATLRMVTYFTLRVGSDPTSWQGYNGKVAGR